MLLKSIFICLIFGLTVTAQDLIFELTHNIDCHRVPPAFRCTNKDLTQKCKFDDFCQEYQDTVAGSKVKLTVLFSSFCYHSQKAIVEVVFPKIYKHFGDHVDIEFVPFGNANRTSDGKISCKLGEQECLAHSLIGCAQQYLNETVPFVYCLEKNLKYDRNTNATATKCYDRLAIDSETQKEIEKCALGNEGRELQQHYANVTESAYPDWAEEVPWYLIDNVTGLHASRVADKDLPQTSPAAKTSESSQLQHFVSGLTSVVSKKISRKKQTQSKEEQLDVQSDDQQEMQQNVQQIHRQDAQLSDKEESDTSSQDNSLIQKEQAEATEAGDETYLDPEDESALMRRKAEFLQTKSKYAYTHPPDVPRKRNFFAS